MHKFGSLTWARTTDPLINSQLLYHLSYQETLCVWLYPYRRFNLLHWDLATWPQASTMMCLALLSTILSDLTRGLLVSSTDILVTYGVVLQH